MSANATKERPVDIAFSGPSGGVVGAAYLARQAGVPNVLTLDMGGTSTDVVAVHRRRGDDQARGAARLLPVPGARGRHPQRGRRRRLDRLPEPRRARCVSGPVSAGRRPRARVLRPGRRGSQPSPTPTSSWGGSRAQSRLGGSLELDVDAAHRAVEKVGAGLGIDTVAAAQAIIDIANENMHAALRVVSVERGYDPRDFGLVAFGGAGPVHANALCKLIGAKPLIIPSAPGVLSAYGFIAADVQNEFARTYLRTTDVARPRHELRAAVDALVAEAREWLGGEEVATRRSGVRGLRRLPLLPAGHPDSVRARPRGAEQRLCGARCGPTSRASIAGATASTLTRRSRSPRCAWSAAA